MPNDFDREMQKIIKEETRNAARDAEKTLNSVAKTHRGKPASQVKPALRRKLQSQGWKLSDRELTSYAEDISNGHDFKVKPPR